MAHQIGYRRFISSRRPTSSALGAFLTAMLLTTTGCTTHRVHVAQTLGSGMPAISNYQAPAIESYRFGCPDVLELAVDGVAECTGQFAINPEGRIGVAILGNPRVEGETVAGLTRRVAHDLRVTQDQVRCRVVAYRSRSLYVHGPIEGRDRAVAYCGSESVVNFIRRCGGLTNAANVKDIHIVRGNVALGLQPQLFAVDLEKILLENDPKTNVLLLPFDEVYIGELRRSKAGKALPHWLRPVYRGFCGLFPGACPQDWRQQIRDLEP